MAKTSFALNQNGNYSNSVAKVSINATAAETLAKGKIDGIGKRLNEYGWTIIKPVIEIEADLFSKLKDF